MSMTTRSIADDDYLMVQNRPTKQSSPAVAYVYFARSTMSMTTRSIADDDHLMVWNRPTKQSSPAVAYMHFARSTMSINKGDM